MAVFMSIYADNYSIIYINTDITETKTWSRISFEMSVMCKSTYIYIYIYMLNLNEWN